MTKTSKPYLTLIDVYPNGKGAHYCTDARDDFFKLVKHKGILSAKNVTFDELDGAVAYANQLASWGATSACVVKDDILYYEATYNPTKRNPTVLFML